jgi:hypothetical protein
VLYDPGSGWPRVYVPRVEAAIKPMEVASLPVLRVSVLLVFDENDALTLDYLAALVPLVLAGAADEALDFTVQRLDPEVFHDASISYHASFRLADSSGGGSKSSVRRPLCDY